MIFLEFYLDMVDKCFYSLSETETAYNCNGTCFILELVLHSLFSSYQSILRQLKLCTSAKINRKGYQLYFFMFVHKINEGFWQQWTPNETIFYPPCTFSLVYVLGLDCEMYKNRNIKAYIKPQVNLLKLSLCI